MTDLTKLRVPFPASAIGHLPKGGKQLDYVGHAAVTERLLEVDPEWFWEPFAWDADGSPLVLDRGNDAVLWIRLTVAGVTRIGVGIVEATRGELEKQLISDALRNAAMRFGVALDLWKKDDDSGASNGASRRSSPPAPSNGGIDRRALVDECKHRGLPSTKANMDMIAAELSGGGPADEAREPGAEPSPDPADEAANLAGTPCSRCGSVRSNRVQTASGAVVCQNRKACDERAAEEEPF